jgi:hypothetical protein
MIGDDSQRPRAAIVGDSFMVRMIPLLSEHFSRSVYVSLVFDPDVILDERPDLVIEELVERRLSQPLPENLPPIAGFKGSP